MGLVFHLEDTKMTIRECMTEWDAAVELCREVEETFHDAEETAMEARGAVADAIAEWAGLPSSSLRPDDRRRFILDGKLLELRESKDHWVVTLLHAEVIHE